MQRPVKSIYLGHSKPLEIFEHFQTFQAFSQFFILFKHFVRFSSFWSLFSDLGLGFKLELGIVQELGNRRGKDAVDLVWHRSWPNEIILLNGQPWQWTISLIWSYNCIVQLLDINSLLVFLWSRIDIGLLDNSEGLDSWSRYYFCHLIGSINWCFFLEKKIIWVGFFLWHWSN